MFKKKAPKRSARGVGITAMLEDEVPGYAEGGEVKDDRAERERLAQMLLEQNREEFRGFAEGERPQMFRPPATMGMVQQPNPQQMQAAQMQQMAQMGMLPRFQEGGIVRAQPLSGWGSRIRGWSEPDPRAGSPGMDNPQFRFREPATPIPDAAYTDPMGGYTGGAEPPPATPDQGLNLPIPNVLRSAAGLPVFPEPEDKPYKPSAESGSPAGDTGGIMGGRMKAEPKTKKEAPEDRRPPGPPKANDLTDIKAEREAKAASARQENMWLALMQAGLAIAGGRSPNAITNIGQGGQAGLGSFMALEQQRRKDEDAATRRDLAEREYQLQVRRQNLQAPLLQAQAAYWQNRPAMDQARLVAQQQVARQRAVDAAQKAWKDELSSPAGQLKYMKMSDPAKQAAQELFLKQEFNRRYQQELSTINAGMYGSPRETGPSSAEE
jgi:hypothetical protein